MDDPSERIRRDLRRLHPTHGALERTLRRVRRRERNRRLGSGAIGAVLTVGLATGLWFSLREERQPGESASPVPDQTLAGDRLVLAGDGELWVVDVATASARRVVMPELTPGDAPHRIVRRDGKLVAWGYRTLVLAPDLDGPPSVLASDSLIFIPSAAQDRVWVGIPDPENTETACLQGVREITVEGEVTVPDTRPPGCLWPVAAVVEGLVFQTNGDTLEVWDPRSREVVRTLPGAFPLAWQGHRLAWCEARCEEAHITDFRSGADLAIRLPEGIVSLQAYEGAFSPDGSRLALVGLTEEDFDRAAGQLVLVDAESGEAEAIAGAVVRPVYHFVEWTPSGRSVFITGGERSEERQLVEYIPEAGTVRDVPAEVGDFFDMAAI